MHEVFEYPFPLWLQSHVFKRRFFEESLSDLKSSQKYNDTENDQNRKDKLQFIAFTS